MTNEEVDRIEFNRWKAERADHDRKRGDYWVSQEGREQIRDTWDDPEDGNCVLPLLNALEQAESKLIRPRPHWDDDPELDGEDAAHPAWWRGQQAGFDAAMRLIEMALIERPTGTIRNERWQALRELIHAMANRR